MIIRQEQGSEGFKETLLDNVTCLYHEEHGHVAALQLAGLLPYRDYSLEVRGQVEDTAYWHVWSDWLKFTVRSLPDLPEAPSSSPLAFSCDSSGTVTFHWAPQPEGSKNGPDFRFRVNSLAGSQALYWRQEVPEGQSSYSLTVAAVNSVGESRDKLHFSVPPRAVRESLARLDSAMVTTIEGQVSPPHSSSSSPTPRSLFTGAKLWPRSCT